MEGLTGKRALVTGAGAGIGRHLALQLSKLGVEVIALSRTQSKLDSLKDQDPRIQIVCVDIEDWDATRKAVQAVTPIQLLVNNAGQFVDDSLLTSTQAVFDKIFAVNVKGPINICQVVINDLLERKLPGSIVTVSSDSSLTGFRDNFTYSLSKAALDSFTKCAVAELSPKGIRFNTVNPGLVLTEMGQVWADTLGARVEEFKKMIPMRRFMEISDVTNVIVFLLSDNSSMVNGHSLPIDGGFLACGTFPSEADDDNN